MSFFFFFLKILTEGLMDETVWHMALKNSLRMPFAAPWMDLEIIILSEVSQKEKGKFHMIPNSI